MLQKTDKPYNIFNNKYISTFARLNSQILMVIHTNFQGICKSMIAKMVMPCKIFKMQHVKEGSYS